MEAFAEMGDVGIFRGAEAPGEQLFRGVDTLAHIDENFKAATSAQVTFVKVTSLRTQYVVSQFV